MTFDRMKKYFDRKGIALVWLALFMLPLILMFAGMAVDISYMYVVKNELQVAADAAALAGASSLSRTDDNSTDAFKQLTARREAWKFACKNTAGNSSNENPFRRVFLVQKGSGNCDDPPASGLNETDNTITGDIVVGNWSATPTLCPSTGLTENFCPANGSTELTINALRVVPRRTGEMIGMPPVRVFFGQIFRLIGSDWSLMSARASAIASLQPPTYGPMPICVKTCTDLPSTPLTGTPPGILITLQNPSCPSPDPELFAWTDFQPTPGSPQNKRNSPTDPPGIYDLLGVDKQGSDWILKTPEPPPNQCCTNTCLRTKQGIGNIIPAIEAIVAGRGKTYTVKGQSIFGWRTFIPVFQYCVACNPCTDPGCTAPDPCSAPGTSPCPGDQPGGYKWVQSVEVIVTGTERSPNAGIYIVGLDESPTGAFTKLGCVSCDDSSIAASADVHLVK